MTEQEAFEEWAIANWPFAADEDAASIWHAALAWLRSQGEPVTVVGNHQELLRVGELGDEVDVPEELLK